MQDAAGRCNGSLRVVPENFRGGLVMHSDAHSHFCTQLTARLPVAVGPTASQSSKSFCFRLPFQPSAVLGVVITGTAGR